MFVLGIDPGLTTTGYGIVAPGARPEAVAAGVIRTDKSLPFGDRLLELHRDLTAVIEQYRPATAAIEQVFVNRNLQTADFCRPGLRRCPFGDRRSRSFSDGVHPFGGKDGVDRLRRR